MSSLTVQERMSLATLDSEALTAYVRRVKAAWRETERNKTWEEKIAAMVRMREREKQFQKIREQRVLAANGQLESDSK